MKRSLLLVLALACTYAAPSRARAETGEASVGLEGGLLVPGFSAEQPAAFALATWSLGGFAQYGVFEDLSLLSRIAVSHFHGSAAHTETYFGRPIPGLLHFATTELGLEMGARYKLYSGYSLAPYVEVLGGCLLATFRDRRLTNEAGQDYGLALADDKAISMTVSLGLVADYRLLNMLFVGVALRYRQGLDKMATHAVVAPVELSYYW